MSLSPALAEITLFVTVPVTLLRRFHAMMRDRETEPCWHAAMMDIPGPLKHGVSFHLCGERKDYGAIRPKRTQQTSETEGRHRRQRPRRKGIGMKLSQALSPSHMTVLIVGGGIGGLPQLLPCSDKASDPSCLSAHNSFAKSDLALFWREMPSRLWTSSGSPTCCKPFLLLFSLAGFAPGEGRCSWKYRCWRRCAALGQARLRCIEPNSMLPSCRLLRRKVFT